MSILDFRTKRVPAAPRGPLVLTMPKPVDEHDRDEAIDALNRLNTDLDGIRNSIVRLQEKERRTVLAIAARKAQLDVLEFETFAAVGREVERAVKLDVAEPTTLESEMTIVETREAAE